MLGPSSRTLDPAAGDGSIVSALSKHGHQFGHISGFEIQGDLVTLCSSDLITHRDALTAEPWNTDTVIMNPPYRTAQQFVERALNEVRQHRGTVAALLRLNWLGSVGRAQFHRHNPSDVYVLSKRPSFSVTGTTDATEYAWFVWGAGRGSRWFIL